MLEERILIDIQNLFINIRFSAWQEDDTALRNCIPLIEEKRALVNHFSVGFQRNILAYSFDCLKDLIATNQHNSIADFADAIHNLPEIFLWEYDLEEHRKTYIEPLRKKYGNQLFAQFVDIFKGDNTNMGFDVKKRFLSTQVLDKKEKWVI